MFEDFKKLFFTDTGKDTSIIFLGTLVNVVIGGLFFLLESEAPEDRLTFCGIRLVAADNPVETRKFRRGDRYPAYERCRLRPNKLRTAPR